MYSIEFEAAGQGASVSLTGTTNLPDGAIISIGAARAHHLAGEDDIRAVGAGDQDAIVQGGAFSATLALDESDLLIAVGTQDFEDQVDQLDRHLTVCAEFQTGVDLDGVPRQPENVAGVVGTFGEALATSPQLNVFGSATDHPSNWLEAKIDVLHVSRMLDELTVKQGFEPEQVELDGFCI